MKDLFNFPDDLKFCTYLIRPFILAAPHWLSIGRITLWCIFFMVSAHALAPTVTPQLPFKDIMKDLGVTPLAGSRSDPRYTLTHINEVEPNSLIWIVGSSIHIKEKNGDNETFIPGQVAPIMKHKGTHYVSIKQSRRLLDTYTLALDAIDKKPDMLVVTLNPFWIFNDKSIFTKTNIMNRGAVLWPRHADWDLTMLMVSPGNMLWGHMGQNHRLIYYGYDYLKLSKSLLQKKRGKRKNTIKKQQPSSKEKDNIIEKKSKPLQKNYKNALRFWLDKKFGTPIVIDSDEWRRSGQSVFMGLNVPSQADLAVSILMRMIKTIEKSGIPTLFYMPPISSELEDTSGWNSYQEVRSTLLNIAEKHQTPQLQFIVDFPDNVTRSLKHRDYLHLRDSGNMPRALAQKLDEMIAYNKKVKK